MKTQKRSKRVNKRKVITEDLRLNRNLEHALLYGFNEQLELLGSAFYQVPHL